MEKINRGIDLCFSSIGLLCTDSGFQRELMLDEQLKIVLDAEKLLFELLLEKNELKLKESIENFNSKITTLHKQ